MPATTPPPPAPPADESAAAAAIAAAFPGPYPRSVHTAAAFRHTRAWGRRYGLEALGSAEHLRVVADLSAVGTGIVLPTAARRDVALGADLSLWLTLFDDLRVETAAEGSPLLADIAGLVAALAPDRPGPGRRHGRGAVGADAAATDAPFTAALTDLLARFARRAAEDPRWYPELTASLRDALLGMVWDAHHQSHAEAVTLAEYTAMRRETILVRPLLVTARIFGGHPPPRTPGGQARAARLDEATATLCGWLNDLAPPTSGRVPGSEPRPENLTLAAVLAREFAYPPAQAAAAARRECIRQAMLVRELIDTTRTAAVEPLPGHATAAEHLIRAFVWHTAHPRYRAP